jgi:hypothetical protein
MGSGGIFTKAFAGAFFGKLAGERFSLLYVSPLVLAQTNGLSSS